jgi:hypothetical protein
MSDDISSSDAEKPARKGRKDAEAAKAMSVPVSGEPVSDAVLPNAETSAAESVEAATPEPVAVSEPPVIASATSAAPVRHGILLPLLAALVGVAIGFGGFFFAVSQGFIPLGPAPQAASPVAPPKDDGKVSALEEKLRALEEKLNIAPQGDSSAFLGTLKADLENLKSKAVAQGQAMSREADEKVQAMGQTLKGYADEVKALKDRLARSETQLSAVEGSNKATSEAVTKQMGSLDEKAQSVTQAGNHAALALAVTALKTQVDAGQPFASELKAVKALGGDDALLKALEPAAGNGLPSNSAVRQRFTQVLPAMLAAVPVVSAGSWFELAQQKIEKLVSVRPVGDAAGESPKAIIARIEARVGRNEFAGALAEFDKLPAPVRDAGKIFAEGASARLAGDKALKGLTDQALGQLGSK